MNDATEPVTSKDTCGSHLCIPAHSRKRAKHRLAIAKGHLESILKMLEDESIYCIDVLRQIKAVQGALGGASDVILKGHLEAHVATAQTRGDAAELVDELMEVIKYT
ncbi:MAG: metal-sensitive transcriptional regulator [Deinococcaceae bacterium]